MGMQMVTHANEMGSAALAEAASRHVHTLAPQVQVDLRVIMKNSLEAVKAIFEVAICQGANCADIVQEGTL